jgi:hypothetical protein
MTEEQHVWVYPGDTLLDIVKRMMKTYRAICMDCPDCASRAQAADQLAHENPRLSPLIPSYAPYEDTQLVTDQDAAHLANLSPVTIRKWASEGRINRYVGDDGSRRYMLGEILSVQQGQRQTRAKRAS